MEQRAAQEKIRNIKDEANFQAKAKPARKIHIPELYRLPAGGRELQGCMKARA